MSIDILDYERVITIRNHWNHPSPVGSNFPSRCPAGIELHSAPSFAPVYPGSRRWKTQLRTRSVEFLFDSNVFFFRMVQEWLKMIWKLWTSTMNILFLQRNDPVPKKMLQVGSSPGWVHLAKEAIWAPVFGWTTPSWKRCAGQSTSWWLTPVIHHQLMTSQY